MGTSPITLGVGNGAALRLLLATPAQGAAPPAQGQPPCAGQAEFVVCDQTIERLVNRLKQFRAVATRYGKTAESFLALVQLAASRLWLRFVHTA
jgi:transposase